MNPVTLLEAFAEPHLLIGMALGAVAGLLALWHRNGSLWMFSLGLVAIITYVVNSPYVWSGVPPLHLIAAMVAVATVASLGASRLAKDVSSSAVGACLVLTALGVWGTVPETDMVLGLFGVALGGSLGALRARGDTLRPLAAALFFAAAGFSAITEGIYRDSAPIGALAVAGVFVLYPIIARWLGSLPGWIVVAAQVVLVIVCGRIAGTAPTALLALAIALTAHATIGAALVLLSRSLWREPKQSAPPTT